MADRGFLQVRARPPYVRFGNLNAATVSIITRIINNRDFIYLCIYLLIYLLIFLFSISVAITFPPTPTLLSEVLVGISCWPGL